MKIYCKRYGKWGDGASNGAGYLLFCYTWMLKHWFQHNTLIIWLFADAANNREQNFKWISFGSTLKRILKEKGLKINTQASRAFAYISSSSSTDTAVITRPKHGILVWPSDSRPWNYRANSIHDEDHEMLLKASKWILSHSSKTWITQGPLAFLELSTAFHGLHVWTEQTQWMEPSPLIDEDDEMGEAPKNATKCCKTD